MAKKIQESAGGQVNGVVSREAALIGSGPEHSIDFDLRDVADIAISNLSLPELAKSESGTE